MSDSSSEQDIRALIAPPSDFAGPEVDVEALADHLGAAPSDELVTFLRGWGGLAVVPVSNGEVDDESVMLEILADQDSGWFSGDDFDEMLFDIGAVASCSDSDLRAVTFAWLGVVPSEGQLWFWRDRERSGVAYVDERSVAHPASDDVFAAVVARLTGAPPFDEEFAQWGDHTGLRVIESSID